jgi:hypothetical protein
MKVLIALVFIVFSCPAFAQEENWDVYLAEYAKGPGSTLVDMGLRRSAPLRSFPFLVVTGVAFTDCNSEGMPTSEGFTLLYGVSDSVRSVMQQTPSNRLAGTFTYQCERLDYYYVADTAGIREKLVSLYDRRFKDFRSSISIKRDSAWGTYLNFLYPNEETIEYMSNSKVLMKLSEAGDKLTAPRKIDHWLYFASTNGRDCFIAYAKANKYKIELTEKTKDPELPYKLHISRIDKIDIASISKTTLKLKQQAVKCNGDYDGWETFVVK